MEIFQELTFTAFLALIFSFVLAKLIPFAISNSNNADNTTVRAVDQGAVSKDATLNKGLTIKSTKMKKRVTFVDDAVVERVDLYESENHGSEEKIEKSIKRVDQFEEKGLNQDSEMEQGFDLREVKTEVPIEKKCGKDESCGGEEKKLISSGEESINMEEDKGGLAMEISDDTTINQKEKNLFTTGEESVIMEKGRGEFAIGSDDLIIDQKDGNGVTGFEENQAKSRDCIVDDDDDDWEGIERSELDKEFAKAVNYVEYGGNLKENFDDHLAKLGSDVQMQLYGLHKVAVGESCQEAQPMALKVSARAKWNAWKSLGSMSPEVAMEHYIQILSDNIPHWTNDSSGDDNGGLSKIDIDGNSSAESRNFPQNERNSEVHASDIGDSSSGTNCD